MDTLKDYVNALMDLNSTEQEFLKELCETLKIEESDIKRLTLKNKEDGLSMIHQVLSVELVGSVKIDGNDLAEINGKIITPKTIELEVGEIPL